MAEQEDWLGYLTLEGPLLEMAYAALCISKGEEVVPRYETLGIIHDLLLEEKEGYVFCECAGQPKMTAEKLLSFEEEVLTLQTRLKDIKDKEIRKARFISLVDSSEWSQEARNLLDKIKNEFVEKSIELTIENPKRLFYEFITRSVIGLRIMDNKVFFVGPGEWGVRYDRAKSKFRFSESDIDFDKFRKTPQSFIPRDYWTGRYRRSFVEYALSSKESLPEWFSWEFPHKFGIVWRSLEQMKKAIMSAEVKEGNKIVDETDNGFIVLKQITKIKLFNANIVLHSDRVLSEDGTDVEFSFSNLIERAIENSVIDFENPINYRIYTDTVTFSPNFWSTVKDRIYDGRLAPVEILRGDDILLKTLNEGIIGFKLTKGRITLSLEDTPDTLILKNGALKWEVEEERPYPATLKF